VDIPEVRYARNGDVAIAYQVVGDGPIDLMYLPPHYSNLDWQWEHPPSRTLSRTTRLFLPADRRRSAGLGVL